MQLFFSCTPKEDYVKEKKKTIHVTDAFDSARTSVQDKILHIFSGGDVYLLNGDTISETHSLAGLYAYNNYSPFWLNQKRIEDVLKILNLCYTDGLNPEDYQYSNLKSQYATCLKDGITPEEALNIEISVSHSVLLYVKHLYRGKVDPLTIFPNWNYKQPASEVVSDSMLVCYFTSNLDSLPAILKPKYEIYHSLRKKIKTFR